MNFEISEDMRNYACTTTGHSYDELISMPLKETEKVDSNKFSPFQDPNAKGLPSRGSVYLQLKLIARIKDVSRCFFKF